LVPLHTDLPLSARYRNWSCPMSMPASGIEDWTSVQPLVRLWVHRRAD
jgi:hypothetical protein